MRCYVSNLMWNPLTNIIPDTQFINVSRASRYIDGMLRDSLEGLGASMKAQLAANISSDIDEGFNQRCLTEGASINLNEKEMKTTSMNINLNPKLHR